MSVMVTAMQCGRFNYKHQLHVGEFFLMRCVFVWYQPILSISFRVTSLPLEQFAFDCPSATNSHRIRWSLPMPLMQPRIIWLNRSGAILRMGSANERRFYYVTSSFIGWGHNRNDPRIKSTTNWLYNQNNHSTKIPCVYFMGYTIYITNYARFALCCGALNRRPCLKQPWRI